MAKGKRLGIKEKYNYMTRDLAWELTSKTPSEVYPLLEFEGISALQRDIW